MDAVKDKPFTSKQRLFRKEYGGLLAETSLVLGLIVLLAAAGPIQEFTRQGILKHSCSATFKLDEAVQKSAGVIQPTALNEVYLYKFISETGSCVRVDSGIDGQFPVFLPPPTGQPGDPVYYW